MPLDTHSTYAQTLLRTDGRRWNELRALTLSISTSPTSADGSSLVTHGNTTILCTVTGPRESKTNRDATSASIECEVHVAPFASADRRRRGRNDKRITELQNTVAEAVRGHVFGVLFPRSTISIALHVLSADGGLLAGCLNAAGIALVDAGVPMPSLLCAVSSGVIVDGCKQVRELMEGTIRRHGVKVLRSRKG